MISPRSARPLTVILFLAATHATAMVRSPGFAILEAVGSPDLGYAAVTSDSRQEYSVAGHNEFTTYGMRAGKITADEVILTRTGVPNRVAPVLHRPIPFDLFLVALVTVYQRSIIVAGGEHLPRTVSEDVFHDPARLAEECKKEGLDLRVFDDIMLVRSGRFPADLRAYEPRETDRGCEMTFIRAPMSRIRTALQLPADCELDGRSDRVVSLRSYGLSHRALRYYLNVATCPDALDR